MVKPTPAILKLPYCQHVKHMIKWLVEVEQDIPTAIKFIYYTFKNNPKHILEERSSSFSFSSGFLWNSTNGGVTFWARLNERWFAYLQSRNEL